MSENSKTATFFFTAPIARTSRIQNQWKRGLSLMGWAKGSGAAAGATINLYGSSDPGTNVGTGQMGDGNPQRTDTTSKQVLVASVHPTTASVGATGIADATNAGNVACHWDYLFLEIVNPLEGTTTQVEVTISGLDAD